MKQIIRLERYRDFRGESYDGVDIDFYVDTKTLVCKEIKTGDILIPYDFTVGGNPKFPRGTYERYANGETYATILIECEFEEMELELDQCIYDTLDGILDYVHDLDTLHEVLNTRYIAGYKKHIRLNEFKIFDDRIYLDVCGNVGVQMKDKGCYSMRSNLPTKNDVCKCCGKYWNIYNMFDIFENNEGELFHKKCYLFDSLNTTKKEFINAIKSIYPVTELEISIIPNEYDNYEGYAPWFIFHTTDGDIKIGWRKRVISIEWLDSYKQFNETFENENTTKGSRYIHAYGYDKLTEYIKRAKESIRG